MKEPKENECCAMHCFPLYFESIDDVLDTSEGLTDGRVGQEVAEAAQQAGAAVPQQHEAGAVGVRSARDCAVDERIEKKNRNESFHQVDWQWTSIDESYTEFASLPRRRP